MRAVIVREFGSADGMEVVARPIPTPAPGQLAIRIEAIGVAGVDAVIRRGTLGESAFGAGWIPGSEIAGTVTAVGDDVDAAWIGRRVWAFTGVGGAYAEHAVVPLEDALELPADADLRSVVTLGSSVPVAHFALERARLAAGERVLVRGAAGSIGIAAVDIAARSGASVVAVTTASIERGERLRAFGATQLLDRGGAPFTDASSPPSDGSASEFDVVLDIVGGEGLPSFLDRLAPNGRLVAVGVVAGNPPADFGAAMLRNFRRSISFGTLSLDTVDRGELAQVRCAAFAAAARGEIPVVIDDVLPLENAAEAHRRMDAGGVLGRIVLVP